MRGDDALFERICLEGFQAGLSWWSILKRREAFREEFDQFTISRLAQWNQERIDVALSNPEIIRNRAKVKAVITNAVVAVSMAQGELTDLIWSFANSTVVPANVSQIPAITPESEAMSRELKARGFVFIGPTTCYALMQACGLVNDHLANCAFR